MESAWAKGWYVSPRRFCLYAPKAHFWMNRGRSLCGRPMAWSARFVVDDGSTAKCVFCQRSWRTIYGCDGELPDMSRCPNEATIAVISSEGKWLVSSARDVPRHSEVME